MAEIKVTVRKDGPYRVEGTPGSVEMVDASGNPYDLSTKVKEGKLVFHLCRCGGSITRPFCDGAHSRIGFQGAELAVQAEIRKEEKKDA